MHQENIRNFVVLFAILGTVTGCGAGMQTRSENQVSYARTGDSAPATEEASAGGPTMQPSVQYQQGGSGEPGSGAEADMEAEAPSMPAPSPPSDAPSQPSSSMAMTRSAPAPRHQAEPAVETPPQYRPGLGTEFGEQRNSQISFVSFERASAQPFATVALNYNDAQGIAAMVNHAMARGAAMAPVGIDPRGELTISIIDEYGRPLSALSAGGRIYIIGEAGRRYSIQVRNNGPRRFEIVASVDGLDVMDGREASFAKRGYIAAPYQSFNIDGFRTSEAQVAAFRFGSVRNSYAARTGSARNVGVIGIALFSEMGVNYWDENEIHLRENADPFPGRFSQPPQ